MVESPWCVLYLSAASNTMTSVSCLKNGCKLRCDIEGCVINNGWMSDCIKIERGVRQACPLSPYLFVLSVEVLANAIRRDPSIKGISKNDVKLSQYADDTTLILVDGSKDVLDTSLGIIETFSKIFGLRLHNKKKIEELWID